MQRKQIGELTFWEDEFLNSVLLFGTTEKPLSEIKDELERDYTLDACPTTRDCLGEQIKLMRYQPPTYGSITQSDTNIHFIHTYSIDPESPRELAGELTEASELNLVPPREDILELIEHLILYPARNKFSILRTYGHERRERIFGKVIYFGILRDKGYPENACMRMVNEMYSEGR